MNLPIRGDYEVPVKAVIDFVDKRPDLDPKRVGMWGVSLGGYYAPRAAAFDKRIRACIALGGPFNWGANWDGLPELTRRRSACAATARLRRRRARMRIHYRLKASRKISRVRCSS